MPPKPNILLIMADQLIPMLTGAYGHPVVQTPNLNSLVESGVRFDAAYSNCPLCAPARACLMTGQYIAHNKVWDNASPLAADCPTLAHYLSSAGYDTLASGKMHYIGPDQLHGLSRRLTTDIYPAGYNMLPTAHRSPQDRRVDHRNHAEGYRLPRVGPGTWTQYLAYDSETQFRAVEYLRQRAASVGGESAPLFLLVSYHCPHDPFVVPPSLWDLYADQPIEIPDYPPGLEASYSKMDRWLVAYHGTDEIDIRQEQSLVALRRAYYGLVTWIDRLVGDLLRVLEETGQRDNTMILFCSDHGDMLAEKNMVQKRSFYEYSSRVPLILNFPDGYGAGSTCDQPVSLIDIAPTLLDMLGLAPVSALDGQSLLSALQQPSQPRLALAESHTNGVYAPCFMIRQGHFKYVYVHDPQDAAGSDEQLFDLACDPGEWHNLAADPAQTARCASLRQEILSRLDPDAVEAELQQSLIRRHLIRDVAVAHGTHWDYSPRFDAETMYCR